MNALLDPCFLSMYFSNFTQKELLIVRLICKRWNEVIVASVKLHFRNKSGELNFPTNLISRYPLTAVLLALSDEFISNDDHVFGFLLGLGIRIHDGLAKLLFDHELDKHEKFAECLGSMGISECYTDREPKLNLEDYDDQTRDWLYRLDEQISFWKVFIDKAPQVIKAMSLQPFILTRRIDVVRLIKERMPDVRVKLEYFCNHRYSNHNEMIDVLVSFPNKQMFPAGSEFTSSDWYNFNGHVSLFQATN